MIPAFTSARYAVAMLPKTPAFALFLATFAAVPFAHARGSVSALQSSTHVGMMALTTAVIVPFAQQSLQRFAAVMLASVLIGTLLWKIYLATHPPAAKPAT